MGRVPPKRLGVVGIAAALVPLAVGCSAILGLRDDYQLGAPEAGADAAPQDGNARPDASASDGSDAAPDAGNPCPTTQLLAFWKADGTGADQLAAFDLTAKPTPQSMSYPVGHTGQSFAFVEAGTQWMESSNVPPALGALTVEAWVNTSVTGKGTIFSTRLNASGLSFGLGNGFPSITLGALTLGGNGGTAVAKGAWSHVAIAIDGSSVRFYIDGNLNATKSLGGGAPKDTAVRLGRGWSVPDDPFEGQIDDVAIYGKALSTQDVKDLYAGAAKCR